MGKDNNIKKCDVLLTYEIKNREIENLCLIKRELERRGYTVLFRMQYGTFFETEKPIEAKVVVVPGYFRERAKFYSSSHTIQTNKIVNMMWEQVFNASDEDNPAFLASIKPWGRSAVHLAWGNHTQERLINEWGVKEDHAPITGQIALDYLRGSLINYYMNRDEIFAKYNIPKDKKIHLFISSLSFVGLDKRVVKNAGNEGDPDSSLRFAQLSLDTRNALLSWFEKVLSASDNDVIIYRPHPEETNCAELYELASRKNNFLIIKEESVKQWILVCDKIYTWLSTSIAEAYAAGRGFAILRPVEIPYESDIKMFHQSPQITTYDEFCNVFNQDIQTMPISPEALSNYYKIDKEKYSYSLVCDVIEKVLNDDTYNLDTPLNNPFKKGGIFNKERIANFIKRRVAASKLMYKIHKGTAFQNTNFRELLDNVFYVKEKLEKNYVSDEQINRYIEKIENALRNNNGVSAL